MVEFAIHRYAQLSGLAHGDDQHHVSCPDGFANLVRARAVICQEDARFEQVTVRDQIRARIVRCLSYC